MGLSHAPRVITDGIVLGLDAANTRSYVGSGTTWTDLIGSNNGTLNGPVFTQEPKLEPFGGAGAVSFDGSGSNGSLTNTDYLTIPQSSSWLYTGDYTIEFWLYQTTNTDWCAYDTGGSGSADQFTAISGTVYWGYGTAGAVTGTFGSGDVNTWVHWAVSRSGTTTRMFKNGVVVSSATGAVSNIGRNNAALFVGVRRDGFYRINGYLSNLRVVKGTALYTSNFTPPRKKLEVTSDTVLLTCEKGTIRDRSSSAHAITINGDAKSISGASYFEFDGTDDNCSLGPSSDFTPGTGPFTIEMWIYPTATPSQYEGPANYTGSGVDSTSLFWAYRSGYLDLINNGDSYTLLRMTYPTLNQWVHLVASRDASGYFAVYENGVVKASTTSNSDNYEQTEIYIGGRGAYIWPGKVSVFKMYKGKGLTAAEVSQNFNALRGRYGI